MKIRTLTYTRLAPSKTAVKTIIYSAPSKPLVQHPTTFADNLPKCQKFPLTPCYSVLRLFFEGVSTTRGYHSYNPFGYRKRNIFKKDSNDNILNYRSSSKTSSKIGANGVRSDQSKWSWFVLLLWSFSPSVFFVYSWSRIQLTYGHHPQGSFYFFLRHFELDLLTYWLSSKVFHFGPISNKSYWQTTIWASLWPSISMRM